MVSSGHTRASDIVFDDLNYQRRDYDSQRLRPVEDANILFASSWMRGERDGIRAFSLHPGTLVDTTSAERARGRLEPWG